jgi:hypothetical protein
MGNTDEQRTWTKTDGEDAARLLQELAQRADKASGGLKRPEQIQYPAPVPCAGEKAGEESANREAASHPRQQLTVTGRGVSDGLVLKADNDNRSHAAALASCEAR